MHRGLFGRFAARCICHLKATCSFSKRFFPIGGAGRQMKNLSTFLLPLATSRSPECTRSYKSSRGDGRQDFFPPSSPLSAHCTCVVPGCGILGTVMVTDCDVSYPGPGNRTTSGCELIEWWVHHLRQGGPAASLTGVWPPGRAPVPLHHVLQASSTSSCCLLPPKTDASCRFPSWVSISVT